jgi:3-oxoacyl-[acyl-carrier protein] reductase
MNLGLNDKVIMLAGASKGLGYAIANALAADGATLAIASRNEAGINAAADSLRKRGGEVLPSVMDASCSESISAWVELTLKTYGRIDGLLVNAGGPPPGRFDDIDDVLWQQAFELTLMSAIRMIRCVLPTMRAQGSGSILTLTSSSVREPIDFLLLSNVMRSGVNSLAKSLSRQLAPEGIRINNLVPGLINTDRMINLDKMQAELNGLDFEEQRLRSSANIPMGRYGDPDEFGKAGAFLLSDAASYITGATLVVDGGSMKSVS